MSDLIKRKDGSYSPRGLWDNIRDNKGSGKKPTKQMLAQERKIKKMDDGGILDYIKKGISSAINYINPFDSEETAKPVSKPVAKPIVKSKPLFSNELKLRQSVMESHHKPSIATGKEVSPKGAKGLTQIMPSMLSDFQRHNPGVKINLSNPKDAKAVQDWALDYIAQRPYLNKPNQDRKVYQAKVLAAYNWGPGNMKKFLGKQKSAGVDIYNSLNWIEKLPKEPRNYIKGILLNKLPGFQKQLERDTLNSPYNKYYNFGRGGMLWFNQKGGVITDQRGQWAHPGKVTKIMGNDITMKGVPYPVFAETNKGQQVIMQPGQDYHFTGAKSVTEYPMPTTHDYKISKYLLPQHKEGGTMEKFGNVPYDAADAHKKPLSNGLWALPFKNGGQLYGKSGIHIKPENRGKFTASANRAGMGVQAFASKVLANKEKYSPTLVKRANFARNAAKWKHQFGGSIDTLKMALGGQMGSPKARISTPLRTDRSSAAGMMDFTQDSSPKARMFEGGDFPNSTFGDKTIPAKSYKMGGHMLSRPDHWVQAGDAVQDLNKNPQQSWYGESNRAKATAPVFQGGVKKPLMKMGGKTKFSKMC